MSTEMYNEIELLKASMQGDAVAFEAIVKKYQSFICAITFSATANFEKSEELAQETFISAWKDLAQLKDLSKFRGWLSSIARNIIRNSFRSQKQDLLQKSVSLDQVQEDGVKDNEPSEAIITKEQQAVVQQALKQIPERYREPLVLFYREQQSVKQVAEELDLTEEAAKQRLSRGRKMLKEQVAAMVETTISRTGPGKAFTTAVIASIAGMAIKGSGVAAAASIVAGTSKAGTATATGVAAVMSGVTAKIITAAAVVAVGVGSIVAYKHITKPNPEPQSAQTGMVVRQKQGDEWNKTTDEVIEQPSDETANLLDVDKAQSGLESGESFVASPESVSTKGVEFKFVPKGVLSGLITGAETGEPVTDAIITVSKREIYHTKTDANGFYSIEEIKDGGDFSINVISKKYVGFHDRNFSIHIEKDVKAVKHFELERACQIEIKVVDELGSPIEGVRFISTALDDENKRPVYDAPNVHEKTNEDGLLLLGGFKPSDSPYLITATHRKGGEILEGERGGVKFKYRSTYYDYAPDKLVVTLTNPDKIESGQIILKKGFDVLGYAEYEDDEPADGLEISPYPDWWHSHTCPEDYVVDSNGYFTLKHMLAGNYNISYCIPHDDGSTCRELLQTKFPNENNEILVLKIPGKSPENLVSIRGIIKFVGKGQPDYVHISARSSKGIQGYTDLSHNYKGGLNNNFTVDRLEPGIYTLNFSGGNIENTTINNVKAPSEGLVFEIPVKQQTKLRGKVLDKYDGNPVSSFEVRLDRNWVHFENSEGKFEIASKGNECRRVNVRAEGYSITLSENICPDANEPTLIELGIGGAIEGKVVDEKGIPIENANISYRYSRSRGEKPEDKYIATSDVNGLFTIEDVPEEDTWQWFVISHPNYAPELKQIEVAEDYITEIEIVLKKGGAVEGHVYDTFGKPIPDTTLYFLDESRYQYWKENRARLGSATTDSDGYYRITGLPEKLCFGFRHEPDEQLGVVHAAILPKNGKSNHLDFGGQWYTTGRLLQAGTSMANIKVMIRGNTAGYETAFTAYAKTDSDGRFTFWGIPSGRKFIYWSIPGMHGLDQWVEIGQFDFESGLDMDLNDFDVSLSEVSVKTYTENPKEKLDQLDVYVQKYDEKMFYGRRVGQLSPRTDPNDPYIFLNMAPGTYEAIGRRPGCPTIHKVFEITQGHKQSDVDLWVPAGSASLSGKIVPSDPKERQMPLMLRSISQEVTMGIQPAGDGSYEIGNLPAGDYIIGRASVALSRQSKIKEVNLKSGENKKLDIEVDSVGKKYGGYLVVVIVTEEGLPLSGTNVWLEKGGQTITPHFDSDKSKSFAGDAGEYTLYAEYPGYRKIQQRVSIKSKEGLSTQEILKPVVITMFKL